MQDVHEEPLFVQRVAGLDIAKAEVEVTIRVPSDTSAGRRQQETRTFGTTRRQLLDLADWLRSRAVTKIGMEATSDYWKPVFFLLESKGFDCDLYNAAQVKALPGRPKTDLLTELRGGLGQVSGRMGARVATVAGRDGRRGCAAGSVAAGGAAGRVA
jgi:hypothetical protein